MSHDLNLDVILTRSEDTYSWIADLQGLPPQVREHFNYDVPALISAAKRLTKAEQERDEARGHLQLDRAGLKNLREGRDQATDRALELAKELASVRAELASARQELEQLRAEAVAAR